MTNLLRLRLVLLVLLAACAAPPARQPAPPPAAPQAAAPKQAFPIDAKASLIAVTVRRGGPMARLGHDHVIASRTIAGFVDPATGRADFQFRLDQMTVDETALRREAGLDTDPPGDAIAGTRANMLGKVLEAERFPVVALRAERAPGAAANASERLRLTITLHGVTRSIEVPAKVELNADSISACGQFELKQSDFGIVPMSVLGGAIVVQDPMALRFRIVARRAP